MIDDWSAEVENWCGSLRAAGRPETTIGLRRYHVLRLGREIRVGPWEVTGDQLTDWAGRQAWGVETRRSVRSSVRGFYGWAEATGRVDRSPAGALAAVRPAQPRPRPAPARAVRTALALSEARVRLMIRLGAELGLRRGEVALVHRDDLVEDLAGWSLVVHGKGGRARTVPMSDDLALAVRVATVDGWAFPGGVDGHLSAHYVGKLVSAALGEGVTMHQLRHRFATCAYAVDTDLLVVQRLLGHASPATTQRYVQTPDEAARRTVLAVPAA